MPSLVEIGPVVLEKKIKMWKVDRQTDRQIHGRTGTSVDQKKTNWGFISGELLDKKYKKPFDEDKVNLPVHFIKQFHIHYHLQIIVLLRLLFLQLSYLFGYA